MEPHEEADLRKRLWKARLARAVAHERVVRESAVTKRLHAELHVLAEEAHRLKRRSRWLVRRGVHFHA